MRALKSHKVKPDSHAVFVVFFLPHLKFYLLNNWSNKVPYSILSCLLSYCISLLTICCGQKKEVNMAFPDYPARKIKIQTSTQNSLISQPMSGPSRLPAIWLGERNCCFVKGPKKLKLNRPRIPGELKGWHRVERLQLNAATKISGLWF